MTSYINVFIFAPVDTHMESTGWKNSCDQLVIHVDIWHQYAYVSVNGDLAT